ncbi:STAS domain-containing protein [Rhodococcus sp. HNM0569]|uniref:STAS domain-containing protein n=1 Tax=Rhodococcus sp. HNM0569 TaxID=2716340 RepID=UPI00146D480D|nr:STAS domain-containing protein [Rhodococcus sp. HNM0569]NLU83103.1 STAS domain-containing protein [Rhodococcus sp. HNM0569]
MTVIATKNVTVEGRAGGKISSRNNNIRDHGGSRRGSSVVHTARSGLTAEFDAVDIRPDVALVRVRGEIDLCTAQDLRDFVCARVDGARDIVLDLSSVQFFGTAGLPVLTALEVAVREAGRRWALVSSRPADRMFRAVGQSGLFPRTADVAAALALLER